MIYPKNITNWSADCKDEWNNLDENNKVLITNTVDLFNQVLNVYNDNSNEIIWDDTSYNIKYVCKALDNNEDIVLMKYINVLMANMNEIKTKIDPMKTRATVTPNLKCIPDKIKLFGEKISNLDSFLKYAQTK